MTQAISRMKQARKPTKPSPKPSKTANPSGKFNESASISPSLEALKAAQAKYFAKRKARFKTSPKPLKTVVIPMPKKTKSAVKKGSFSMSFEEAKYIVWNIMAKRLNRENRKIEIDKYNKAIIVNLIKYFIGDKTLRSDWQPHKGLLCVGGVGTGKTFLMKVMRDFCKKINHPRHQFTYQSCHQVYDDINTANPIKSLRKYYKGNYCFDDLGHEPKIFKHYGNDILFMQKIFFSRYDNFQNGHCITHATTNLLPQRMEKTKTMGIKEQYGNRFLDRCKSLFNVVLFDGPSRRK